MGFVVETILSSIYNKGNLCKTLLSFLSRPYRHQKHFHPEFDLSLISTMVTNDIVLVLPLKSVFESSIFLHWKICSLAQKMYGKMWYRLYSNDAIMMAFFLCINLSLTVSCRLPYLADIFVRRSNFTKEMQDLLNSYIFLPVT